MADGSVSRIDVDVLREAMGAVAARNSKRRIYSGPQTVAAVAAEYDRLIRLREADSGAPGKPAMSVPMSDADEGPA